MHRQLLLTVMTLPLVLSSAIATAAETAPTQTKTTELETQPWRLMAYRSTDKLIPVIADTNAAVLRFESGRLTADAGCNQLSGAYSVADSSLSIGPDMATTMKDCPTPIAQQEQAVAAALRAVAGYRRTAEHLELLDTAGQTVLALEGPPSSPLLGVTWIVEHFDSGRTGMTAPIKGAQITLEFRAQGTLGGSDGCNRYMSGYLFEAGRLTIGPIATTRPACTATDGRAEQAAGYAAALGTVAGFQREDRQLSLVRADGTSAVHLRASDPNPLTEPTP
jgi:heat shock protein HslJ